MAGTEKFHPDSDWWVATSSSIGGKTAYTPDVNATIVGTVTTTGGLTNTELRATAVPVSGTVTATGPLTDAQLRATAVPVSGTVTASGPQTNAEYLAANRCTVTKTSVNSAASSTQLLAATAGRKSLTIVNTDANTLFIDTSGGTATNACIPVLTATSWTSSGAVPVGIITGIWAADGAGAATIFEGA